MTPEQVSRLAPLVDEISQCRWEFELPARRVRGRESLEANLCGPFIPDYFPGYDVYVWLDADTWVADWEAIDLYVTGAARMALAITAQTDRAYQDPVRVSWFLGIPFRVKTFYYSNASGLRQTSGALADRMQRPQRRGFRAASRRSALGRVEAPHGGRPREGTPLHGRPAHPGAAGLSRGWAVEILPAWCNWLAEITPPAFAPDLGQFVEPYSRTIASA